MALLNSYFVGGSGINQVGPRGAIYVDESTIPVGLSAPRIVDQTYPGQDGTFWDGAINYEPLEFPLVLTVEPNDLTYRAQFMTEIARDYTQRTSLMPFQYQLIPQLNNPEDTRRNLFVYRSSSLSIRRLNRLSFQASFMLTAPMPFWRGTQFATQVIPKGSSSNLGGASTAPLMDADIILYGPFTTARVTCNENGQSFVFSGTVAAGQRILVRPYKWTVQLQTAAGSFISNRVTKLQPAKGLGSIMDVEPGGWRVDFTGSNANTRAEMVYREWFL